MKTSIKCSSTLATEMSDETINEIYEASVPVESMEEPEVWSKAVMNAYHRAKKASIKNDLRSQKIVDAQRIERCEKRATKIADNPPEKEDKQQQQKSLMDF